VPGAEDDTHSQDPDGRRRIHATAVSYQGRGLLITGAAGSGKSGLALELMALGARLVADDQVEIWRAGAALMAEAPAAIRGRIEARYVGILNAEPAGPTEIALAVDLDVAETERLPPRRSTNLLGVMIPLLHNADIPHFPAAILLYLSQGRSA